MDPSGILSPLTTSSQWMPGCRSRPLFPGLASLMEWFEDISLEAVFAAAAHYAVLEDYDSSRSKYKWILNLIQEAETIGATFTHDSLASRMASTPPDCDDPLLPHPFIRLYSPEERQTIKLIVLENLDYLTHIEHQREYMQPAPIHRIGYRDSKGGVHFFRSQHDRSIYDKAQQEKLKQQQQQQQILLQQLQEQRNARLDHRESIPVAASGGSSSIPILPPAASHLMMNESHSKSNNRSSALDPIQQIQSLRPVVYRCLPPSVSQSRQQRAAEQTLARLRQPHPQVSTAIGEDRSTQAKGTTLQPLPQPTFDISKFRSKVESDVHDKPNENRIDAHQPTAAAAASVAVDASSSSRTDDTLQFEEELNKFQSHHAEECVTIKLSHSRILSDAAASRSRSRSNSTESDARRSTVSGFASSSIRDKKDHATARTDQDTHCADPNVPAMTTPSSVNTSSNDADQASPAFVPLPSKPVAPSASSSLPVSSISELELDEVDDIIFNRGRSKKRRVLLDESSDEDENEAQNVDEDVMMIEVEDRLNTATRTDSKVLVASSIDSNLNDSCAANTVRASPSSHENHEEIEDDFDVPVTVPRQTVIEKQNSSKIKSQSLNTKSNARQNKIPSQLATQVSTKKRKRGANTQLVYNCSRDSTTQQDEASVIVTASTRKKGKHTSIITAPLASSIAEDEDKARSSKSSLPASASSVLVSTNFNISPASHAAIESLVNMQFTSREEAVAFLSKADSQCASSTPPVPVLSSASEGVSVKIAKLNNSTIVKGATKTLSSSNDPPGAASSNARANAAGPFGARGDATSNIPVKKLSDKLQVRAHTIVNQETGKETVVYVLTRSWERQGNNRLLSRDEPSVTPTHSKKGKGK